jgi:hypothetical protein
MPDPTAVWHVPAFLIPGLMAVMLAGFLALAFGAVRYRAKRAEPLTRAEAVRVFLRLDPDPDLARRTTVVDRVPVESIRRQITR